MQGKLKIQKKWNRCDKTFEYIKEYSKIVDKLDTNLSKELGLISAMTVNEKNIDEFLRTESNRKNLFVLVAYFENLAIGIFAGYLDEKIAKESFYSVVISLSINLSDYIEKRRKETGMAAIGSNFERLARNWIHDDRTIVNFEHTAP